MTLRKRAAQRSELLQGVPAAPWLPGKQVLSARRLGVVAVCVLAFALAWGVKTSFFPQMGPARLLYHLHDEVYLPIKGYFYTGLFPASLWLMIVALAAMALAAQHYLTGRPLLLEAWLAWTRWFVRVGAARDWVIRSHRFALKLGAREPALDLIARADWRAALIDAAWSDPRGMQAPSSGACSRLDRIAALRIDLALNHGGMAADGALAAALEAAAVAVETLAALPQGSAPLAANRLRAILDEHGFTQEEADGALTAAAPFDGRALLTELRLLMEAAGTLPGTKESGADAGRVFKVVSRRVVRRRLKVEDWALEAQELLFLPVGGPVAMGVAAAGLSLKSAVATARLATEASFRTAEAFSDPAAARVWLDGPDALRLALESVLESLEDERGQEALLEAQPELAVLERFTKECPGTQDHRRLAALLEEFQGDRRALAVVRLAAGAQSVAAREGVGAE